jgi:FkbM family methyltransferase
MNALKTFSTHLAELVPPNSVTVVDIGAAAGTDRRWNLLQRHLKFVGFEPQESEFNKLVQTPSHRWLKTALAGANETRPFYVTRYWSNCSLLKPNGEIVQELELADDLDIIREEKVACQTLDSALASEQLAPDFIKIDTQGSELEILHGARHALEHHLLLVEVEVEFCHLYQDQPLFADVDQFMRSLGFRLQDLGNFLYKKPRGMSGVGGCKGRIISADALYFRDLKGASAQALVGDTRRLGAALLGYAAYGYPEHALQLLRLSRQQGQTLKGQDQLEAALIEMNTLPAALRWIPCRTFLSKCAREAYRRLQIVRDSVWLGYLGNPLR